METANVLFARRRRLRSGAVLMASEGGDAVGVVGIVSGGADAASRVDGGAGFREVVFGGGGQLLQRLGRVAYYSANFLGQRAQENSAEEEVNVFAAREISHLVQKRQRG